MALSDTELDAKVQEWQKNIDSRYDAGAWRAWSQHYDPKCPPSHPFRPDPEHMKRMGAEGATDCVEKPVDVPWSHHGSNPQSKGTGPSAYKKKGGATGGASPTQPQTPAPPTTFGSQLSFTGNPTVDMLINQFNTRTNLEGTKTNIFGLGEDRRPGGEGASADNANIKGQLLSGGGLWWGQEGFNKGFDASVERKAAPTGGPRKGGGRSRGRGSAAPTPQEIAAPPPAATPPPAQPQTPNLPAYKEEMLYGGGPMGDMLDRRFNKGFGRLMEY